MDASPAAPTLAGGVWDIKSSRPSAAHFATAFELKTEAPRANLGVGLDSSAQASNLGDYLGGHRLIVGSNFGPPAMIGLRPNDPNYYIKEFLPRGEDFVGLYDQNRVARRREEELGAADSPAGASFMSPAAEKGRLNGTEEEGDASIGCFSQYSGRLLPMLTRDKGANTVGNEGDEDEEEGDDDDVDEEEEEEEEGTAWPCLTTPTTASASMQEHSLLAQEHEKSVMELKQGCAARGTSPIACLDCGNQAKKDCEHTRCRTCCKSRGLNCTTHLRSTWVPAYKRRQKQQLFSNNGEQPMKPHVSKPIRAGRPNLEGGSASDAAAAANSHTSTSTGTPPPSSDLNWLQQEGRLKRVLPAEAREHAVFKCVRVTGVNDGQEEYAYQTVVKIGGHTYEGMLYDQGLDRGQASSSSIAELRLGGRSVAPSSSATIDLAGHFYGTSEGVFLGGNHATH